MASKTTEVVQVDDDAGNIPEPSLRNIVDQRTLKWVFVGGKGGVGKTTVSSCLGIQLSRSRERVLLISTDPAHNLSDAFGQKFGMEPQLIHGFTNLYCMEIDPTVSIQSMDSIIPNTMRNDPNLPTEGLKNMMGDIMNNFPGIDEAISFAEIMKQVDSMDYSVIVFDTAPTGHTLRFLSFPTMLDKLFGKLLGLQSSFGNMFSQFMPLMGMSGENTEGVVLNRIEQLRTIVRKVNSQFKNPNLTTFVCVCIPEFLSLYETERLVQELTRFEIDTRNIVVNQVIFPQKYSDELEEWYKSEEPKLSELSKELILKLITRKKMQDKYIDQGLDLYEDFHVIFMPLLDFEVRGVETLTQFSEGLLCVDEEA